MEAEARTRLAYELMHQNLLKSMNAYAIVLSILVTVTYSGFLQPPKPLNSDEDRLTNSTNWQKLFIYFNGFSFFSSVCGLLLFASSSFSPLMLLADDSDEVRSIAEEIKERVKLVATTLPKFVYLNLFLLLSLTCCVAAYAFAGLATVRGKVSEQLPLIITCVLGGVVYIQALFLTMEDVFKFWRETYRSHRPLWEALKRETIFGKVFTKYLECVFGIGRNGQELLGSGSGSGITSASASASASGHSSP